MTISPCKYPRCRDTDGNPRLTQDEFCASCQRRYRHLLDWIVLDYAALKSALTRPVGVDDVQVQGERVFGHPAEWASIACAEIASALNWAEDGLRDELGHEPPIHPYAREALRVKHGYSYLVDQFDRLCRSGAAVDTADELATLHARLYRGRGHFRNFRRLPIPCPACELVGWLTFGDGEGTDVVACEQCHYTVDREHFAFLARVIADKALSDLIEEYDTRKVGEFAAEVSQ